MMSGWREAWLWAMSIATTSAWLLILATGARFVAEAFGQDPAPPPPAVDDEISLLWRNPANSAYGARWRGYSVWPTDDAGEVVYGATITAAADDPKVIDVRTSGFGFALLALIPDASTVLTVTATKTDDAGNVTYSRSLRYLVSTVRPVAGLVVRETGDIGPPGDLPDHVDDTF